MRGGGVRALHEHTLDAFVNDEFTPELVVGDARIVIARDLQQAVGELGGPEHAGDNRRRALATRRGLEDHGRARAEGRDENRYDRRHREDPAGHRDADGHGLKLGPCIRSS